MTHSHTQRVRSEASQITPCPTWEAKAEGRADAGEQVRSEAEPVPSPATQTKGEG